ncbi:hypothetical protein D918_06903 [Trichuris suis]|nr:hypothetical protein D918_06903 [Trichuris suis]
MVYFELRPKQITESREILPRLVKMIKTRNANLFMTQTARLPIRERYDAMHFANYLFKSYSAIFKLKFAPYCFVQDHSAVVIEPCFASCEMAALKTLPNDYWHLVDVYAVGGRQTTWGGVECKPWMKVDPTLFQLHAHTNFCACPSQYRSYCERAGLFCFTTDSEIGWQGCYTTEASEGNGSVFLL